MVLVVKRLPASAGDERDACSIPGSGRSAGGGPGHPLQCSCLENAIDRGAWRATVQRVSQSRTRLKGLSSYTHVQKGVALSARLTGPGRKQAQGREAWAGPSLVADSRGPLWEGGGTCSSGL